MRRTVFKTVYDILNDSTNLKTTRSENGRTNDYTATIRAAFPIGDKDITLPMIVVWRPYKLDEEQVGMSYDGGLQEIRQIIEIFAKSNDLCQEFTDLVENELQTNKSTLRTAGLRHPMVEDLPTPEPIQIDAQNRIHVHRLVLTGKRAR